MEKNTPTEPPLIELTKLKISLEVSAKNVIISTFSTDASYLGDFTKTDLTSLIESTISWLNFQKEAINNTGKT